jgi:hypothetical protein
MFYFYGAFYGNSASFFSGGGRMDESVANGTIEGMGVVPWKLKLRGLPWRPGPVLLTEWKGTPTDMREPRQKGTLAAASTRPPPSSQCEVAYCSGQMRVGSSADISDILTDTDIDDLSFVRT